jgi:hypothetical protein
MLITHLKIHLADITTTENNEKDEPVIEEQE